MHQAPPLIQLLRPAQWVKNLILFLPIFFGREITDCHKLAATTWATLAFCLISSGIYIINDLKDAPQDRQHPLKRHRPLAQGNVSPATACLLTCLLLAAGMGILLTRTAIGHPQALPLLATTYLTINLAYTLWLKQYPLLDVTLIAAGFILRLLAGGAASDIYVSHWLIIMTFLIALFLALAKRYDDLRNFRQTGRISRKNALAYTEEYLQVALAFLSALIAVVYILYTLSPEVMQRSDHRMYYTIPFVLLGILRYLQIILVEKQNCNPTDILLHDRFLQTTIAGWFLTFALILY